MIKRALISVWDKKGIVELAQFLESNHIEILSTGGTKKHLENAGIRVNSVSDITGTGSIMDGRVKTLDPKIFGGILADRTNSNHLHDLQSINGVKIDLVVVNFYPFVEEAVNKKLEFSKAIEFIDIGGPSMIRAAAKNYHSIVPLCSSALYKEFMDEYDINDGKISLKTRQNYACKVFSMTASYELEIFNFFNKKYEDYPETINISLNKSNDLRYGENPHQNAAFYLPNKAEPPWSQLQGKDLSYNNYADMESAISIALEFEQTVCVIVKHSNPCGFAIGDSTIEAFNRAVSTDPISYFGGIVAFNKEIDGELAESLVVPFLECIIAPKVSDEALEIFKNKKNLRVVVIGNDYKASEKSIKSVAGGFLIQDIDSDQDEMNTLEVVSRRKPSNEQLEAMKLGWILVRYVKSNGIVFANTKQLIGVGAGQMSRIDSVKIAIRKVHESGLNFNGSILASDAFFPFADSIEIAAASGIDAIIQPGGSVKDQEVIDKADELNLVMIFTKTRHFYH